MGELVNLASEDRSLGVGGSSKRSASPPSSLADENGAQMHSADRLGEDQVTGCQIDLEIFLGEVEIEDAIALIGVESDVLHSIAHLGSAGRENAPGYPEQKQGGRNTHTLSVSER